MAPIELLPNYTIREASPEEFQEYFRENVRVMFPHSVQFNIMATLDNETIEATKERRKTYQGLVIRWFIECEGAVVGTHIGEELDPTMFYMRNTAIHPDHRRKGLYRAFLSTIIEHLRPHHYQRITSRHAATNNAVIIPKLQAGFLISGMEITPQHGTLVNLSYFYHKQSEDVMRFRTGEKTLPEELRQHLNL